MVDYGELPELGFGNFSVIQGAAGIARSMGPTPIRVPTQLGLALLGLGQRRRQ